MSDYQTRKHALGLMTSAQRDFETERDHFQRLWADRHDQTGTFTLITRPGDATDRSEIRRHALRSCVRQMRTSRARVGAGE